MPKNASSFRTLTHIPPIGLVPGEQGEFERAAEEAYEALLNTLHGPMTAYALARAVGTTDDELADNVSQLQLKYVRMILAKINMDNLE